MTQFSPDQYRSTLKYLLESYYQGDVDAYLTRTPEVIRSLRRLGIDLRPDAPLPPDPSHRRPLIGICGRNDVTWRHEDYRAVRLMRLDAVKMMSETHPDVYRELRKFNPNMFFICRLRHPSINQVGHGVSPAQFVNEMDQYIYRLLETDHQGTPLCLDYQIHNEPNHPGSKNQPSYEGWGVALEQADRYNDWHQAVVNQLRRRYDSAGIRLGFPGLATPHGTPPDYELEWLERCRPAVNASNWLGVHCYWQNLEPGHSNHFNLLFGLRYREYHKLFPDKPIHILECGDSSGQATPPRIDQDRRANEFREWLKFVISEAGANNIRSMHPFILSSPYSIWNRQGFPFVEEGGKELPIVYAVGSLTGAIH